jgi:NAD(P)-dependent dehydrogenase (short-subunit alcohol dehydrogenase family)
MHGVLIAGNPSPLCSALCGEAAARVDSFARALIPAAGSRAAESAPAAEIVEIGTPRTPVDIEWNPASPISARTLLLAAKNKIGPVGKAFLVCVPPSYRKSPELLNAAEIDRIIDLNVKGWYFLARELAAAFKSRSPGAGRGCLALVLQEVGTGGREDAPDLAGPAIAAAFRAFAQSLLLAAAPFDIAAFSSEVGDEAAFASFIFKTVEEGRPGKWHKFGKSRFPLFG